jgi:hypothetical protein
MMKSKKRMKMRPFRKNKTNMKIQPRMKSMNKELIAFKIKFK